MESVPHVYIIVDLWDCLYTLMSDSKVHSSPKNFRQKKYGLPLIKYMYIVQLSKNCVYYFLTTGHGVIKPGETDDIFVGSVSVGVQVGMGVVRREGD